MSRNQKDEAPQRRAEPGQPLTNTNETVEQDRMKVPQQPSDAESPPAERPDLDWVEHED